MDKLQTINFLWKKCGRNLQRNCQNGVRRFVSLNLNKHLLRRSCVSDHKQIHKQSKAGENKSELNNTCVIFVGNVYQTYSTAIPQMMNFKTSSGPVFDLKTIHAFWRYVVATVIHAQ